MGIFSGENSFSRTKVCKTFTKKLQQNIVMICSEPAQKRKVVNRKQVAKLYLVLFRWKVQIHQNSLFVFSLRYFSHKEHQTGLTRV